PQFLPKPAKHVRRGLRWAFVGAARRGEQRPQTGIVERPRQARTALSGGDGENVTVSLETCKHLSGPRKERDFGVASEKVPAVRFHHPAVVLRRQAWNCVRK